MGSIGILNVGAGDTKLVFDNSKPEETAMAAKVVRDMIRLGYAIFIEVGSNEKGPIYQRARDFDEATSEYIIIDSEPEERKNVDEAKPTGPAKTARGRAAGRKGQGPKHPHLKRVAASGTNAVAVAKTAGG
jgi:hypothetical protein